MTRVLLPRQATQLGRAPRALPCGPPLPAGRPFSPPSALPRLPHRGFFAAGARLPGSPSLRRLYVYADAGADVGCVAAVQAQLRRLAPARGAVVRRLDARALRTTRWQHDAALVCFPGGRDLPFLRALHGAPVRALRRWVASGGRYFGSCAGAYFAAARLHFVAARVPRVVGRRPLALFAGVAVGPSQAADRFAYAPGAASVLHARRRAGPSLAVFNRGGCYFVPAPGRPWPATARVLATATVAVQATAPPPTQVATAGHAELPVAISVRLGRGRALLWGAHPELPPPGAGAAVVRAGSGCGDAHAEATAMLRAQLASLLAVG